MPYIKQRNVPYAKVRRLLLGYGLDATALSAVLGCSYNTAAARLKNPQELTLQEIGAINRRGHVPMEELREAISA